MQKGGALKKNVILVGPEEDYNCEVHATAKESWRIEPSEVYIEYEQLILNQEGDLASRKLSFCQIRVMAF